MVSTDHPLEPAMMKPGTRIETNGCPSMGGFPAVAGERAKICRPRKGEGTPPGLTGWHIIQFESDGGRLCMHETRFRVVDNR
jgi:hypothetical protein